VGRRVALLLRRLARLGDEGPSGATEAQAGEPVAHGPVAPVQAGGGTPDALDRARGQPRDERAHPGEGAANPDGEGLKPDEQERDEVNAIMQQQPRLPTQPWAVDLLADPCQTIPGWFDRVGHRMERATQSVVVVAIW
jgi:hypothetical protein